MTVYDRKIVAFHGCDAAVAERLLDGEPFKKSQNDYDWLGEGIYFWEFGPSRALKFAHDQKARGKVRTPAVVGATLQLGNCFDLMDTWYTDEPPDAFEAFKRYCRQRRVPLPKNSGRTPDKLLRKRDCAVLNYYLDLIAEEAGAKGSYDSVRCGFVEGPPAFAGSGIRRQTGTSA